MVRALKNGDDLTLDERKVIVLPSHSGVPFEDRLQELLKRKTNNETITSRT